MSTTPDEATGMVAEHGASAGIFGFFAGLQPIADLIGRLVVAWAFYKSGVTKVVSMQLVDLFGFEFRVPTSLTPTESTLMLFEHEYNVPLLPFELAAQLGTMAEIILPIFIAFGLLGRLSALGLFVFNIVAVLSYEVAQTGFARDFHVLWGIILLYTVAHGPGKISLDALFRIDNKKPLS